VTRRFGFLLLTIGLLTIGPALAADLTHATVVAPANLAQEYGLQCWIWYPAMDPDYSDPATVAAALQEWGGPGGFYDDLGDPTNRPHLEPGVGFEKDPAFFHTARTGFGSRRNTPWRVSWYRHAKALYGNSIQLRYVGLDPSAHYKVRFTQAGDGTPRATRLMANGKFEIHPMRKKDLEVRPVEFEIPAEATAGSSLMLERQANPEESGNGRFVQVSEVWLIRVK
jgi:hypothetical protein